MTTAQLGLPGDLVSSKSDAHPASDVPAVSRSSAAGHDLAQNHHHRGAAGLAWGYNNAGGLGTGGTARALRPVAAVLPAHTVDVQGGTDFTVALTRRGQVFVWGGNRWGQLGNPEVGRFSTRPTLVHIPGSPHITAIAVGQDHVLALTSGGRVFAWGRNHHGQLGDATRVDRDRPVAARVSRVRHIAAGNVFSAALTVTHDLYTWGSAIPGTDFTRPSAAQAVNAARFITTPQRLTLAHGHRAASIDAGQRHLAILTADGLLHSLGVDAAGRPAPRSLAGAAEHVTAISAGDNHTVALTRSGAVFTWGANYHGQLGNGTTVNSDTAVHVKIPGLRGRIAQVVAAGDTVLARTSKGRVYAWGHGGWGQLGNGDGTGQLRPTLVPLPDRLAVSAVHAGRFHVIALVR